MALGCSSKFAKYFLFFFNLLFWICGAAVLGVGIWILTDDNALKLMKVATLDATDSTVRAAAITLVVVGAVIFITGFLGCCGAMRESSCMLMTYTFIVGFILLLQVVAGVLAAVFRNKIEEELQKNMNTTVQMKYGTTDEGGLTEAWDYMQGEFKCCGAINGPDDWKTSAWKTMNSNMTIPDSCCSSQDQDGTFKTCQELGSGTYYEDGCYPKLVDWVKGHAGIIIGVAFGLAVFQVMAIIMGCCLRKAIKSQYEYV